MMNSIAINCYYGLYFDKPSLFLVLFIRWFMITIIFSLLFAIGCTGAPKTNPSQQVDTPSHQQETIVVTNQNLQELNGKKIEIQGKAVRSKAGSFVRLSDGQNVWCMPKNWDWGEFTGKKVKVVGILSEGNSPLDDFPVATQNDKGEWSQGVTKPDLHLDPTPLPKGLQTGSTEEELKPAMEKKKSDEIIQQAHTPSTENTKSGGSGGSLLITVEKVTLAQ